MQRFCRVIFLSLAAGIFVGCLERNLSEAVPIIRTDLQSVSIPAEFEPELYDSTRTVKITSNRSWSAHLNDLDNPIDETDPSQSVSWARLSEEAHPNITHGTETTDLVVTFKRNYSTNPRNGVLHLYSEDGTVSNIPIVQDGAVYHLNPKPSSLNASDDGDYIPILVDCNTNWSVRIAEGTTADVNLPVAEGFDPTTIYLRVKENEEKLEKKVVLVFSATGCADKEIVFTQAATTSDLKIFEVFGKMEINGMFTLAYPRLFVDLKKIDPDAIAAGLKIHYSSSTKSFEDMVLPTEDSPLFPDEGLVVVPESPSSNDCLYVILYGIANGYRKSYSKILIRNWKFGKKFIFESSYGLEMKTDPNSVSDNYIQYNLDRVVTTATIMTESTCKGSGAIFYKIHNGSKGPLGSNHQIELMNEDEMVDYKSFTNNQYLWDTPGSFITRDFTFDKGSELGMTVRTWGIALWDIAILEQYKYKP